jgi:spore germination cell wall hydrolase CwlJ-like protein
MKPLMNRCRAAAPSHRLCSTACAIPAFPNSVCGVVYQGSNQRVCQFSFTCDGSLNRKPSAAAWAAAEAVARER